MTEDVKQEQENKTKQAEDTATVEEEQDVEVTEAGEESVDAEANAETEDTAEEEESAVEATTEDEVRVDVDEEDVATFTGDMGDDKVYTLDELQAASEDYTDDEFHSLASMYEDTLNEIEEKEIVTGRVVSVDEKYVIVDIGFKSEGIIQVNEFPDKVVEELAPGDEIEVFLDKVEDQEGQLILSRRKADILQAWETIERSHDTGEVLEGYIKRRIKGGMVVDIMGIDCFLPGSQIDVRPVRDFDAYVGKTMEFQVVKLNMQAENVVVSHRALIESDLEEQREEILSTIEEGQVLEGIVKNITDFGVFIDLGGVDGLLHITDLSWGRVEHPEEIVSLDQRMNVAVIDFDDESKRVSLGLKQLQPHPWDQIDLKYPEGMKVQGRVVSIADYGAFIELEKGVEGLIHISEMSWTQHIKHPSQLVDKDDIIECVVLNVNEPEKKISLGVKQLEKDPWEDIDKRYPVGSKHTGTVRNLTNFGVFVELEPGIDGLIHVSDLSWTDKINHPNEIIDKDQEIEVVILAIDFENRRITLGHKQIEDNPWEKFAEEHGLGNKVEGEILKITDKGLFVKLPYELEGFVPASKTEAGGDLSESYEVGETVEAYVIELDENNKNLTLSQRDKDAKKVKPSKSGDRGSSQSEPVERGTPTLGEMSGLADLKREMEEKEREVAKQQQAEAEAEAEEQDSEEEDDESSDEEE
ncbi:30S ribosomal protein S1 [Aliifodinibius sp. S!AR15-10]|uniref:30S ribosomal protein S1 n=1 Tax=Aliifodinibius sp. S!AR15-10 TaxID=2950437 RepID=UPI00286697DA|nr:30S ribosomal protein S1 [Aliifodinibius sp. S!AR15-10]MDR8390578.1 30S ribosomal protein S1 [Aliifodinibius sp. S!AR15-10]